MPNENFLYYADTKNVPYGGRRDADIKDLTAAAVKKMSAYRLKALLLACNTATAAAAESLRKSLPFPVIGIEPALKPAALAAHGKKIILLCTFATARQEKFKKLLAEVKESIVTVAPQRLWAELIEKNLGNLNGLKETIISGFCPYLTADTGAVVLGCTHYLFIKPLLKEIVYETLKTEIPFFDGGEGTANNLKNILTERDLLNQNKNGGQLLIVTSSPTAVNYWNLI